MHRKEVKMNQVMLTGRLTKDPDLRYTSGSQTAVCTFSLAVDRPVRQGEEKKADFPRVTVFGKQAESCDKYLSKGRMIAVSGRIQTGSYKDKDGRTVYTTDVVADRIEFLGGGEKKEEPHVGGHPYPPKAPSQIEVQFEQVDEDLPF